MALGLRRVSCCSTPWATELPPRVPRAPALQYLQEHQDDLCAEHRDRIEENPLRVLDCKRPDCAGRWHRAHLVSSTTSATSVLRTSSGSAEGLDALGIAYGSIHRWCAASTTTPAPLSSTSAVGWSPRRTPSAAGAGMTDWSRRWADRRPRRSDSPSAWRGSFWPAEPRRCASRRRSGARRVHRRLRRWRRPPGMLTHELARRRLEPTGPSTAVPEIPVQVGRSLRGAAGPGDRTRRRHPPPWS